MKNSKTCSKCAGKKLWVIDPLRTTYEYSPGTIPLHLDHNRPVGEGWLGTKTEDVGRLALYVCAACGYSELWAGDLERLRPNANAGIALIDGSTGPAQGYR